MEVIENLEKAIEQQIPQALYEALQRASLIVVSDAKQNCPVDDGQLRQSITYQIEKEKDKTIAYVGTNVSYAPYVEKGTGIYNPDGRKTAWRYQDAKGEWHTTRGMREQPFLQPALDNNRQEIMECFKGII